MYPLLGGRHAVFESDAEGRVKDEDVGADAVFPLQIRAGDPFGKREQLAFHLVPEACIFHVLANLVGGAADHSLR